MSEKRNSIWALLTVFTVLFSSGIQASTSTSRTSGSCMPCCTNPSPPGYGNVEAAASEKNPDNPCVVCLERTSNAYSSACGHLSMCDECAKKCESCPMCRKEVSYLKTVGVSSQCKLCHKNAANTLNEACQHLCMCNDCVDNNLVTLALCPECNQGITRFIEVFLPGSGAL